MRRVREPGGLPARDRRRDRLPLRPLPGDRARARAVDASRPSAEQRFEDAARERNRLRAVRSLLERQRVANESVGTLDAIAVAVGDDGEANAQVFQVRDGVLSDRQSFYLDNEAGGDVADVAEAFILQYYASAMMIPPLLVVQRELDDTGARWRRR